MKTKMTRPFMAYSFLYRTIITIVISMMVSFLQLSFIGSQAYADDGSKFVNSTVAGQITPDSRYYLYRKADDGFDIMYRKGINEEGDGIRFLLHTKSDPFTNNLFEGSITPDSRWYIYTNKNDGGKKYIKGIEEMGEGIKLIDANSWGQVTPDSKWYIYNNGNDGGKIYKKGVREVGEGIRFVNSTVAGQITPDSRYYLYRKADDGFDIMYRKGINEEGDGIRFLLHTKSDPFTNNLFEGSITPDSRWYIYTNKNDGGKKYIKGIEEMGEGIKLIDANSWGQVTPDSKWYIYNNGNDGYFLYKKLIDSNTRPTNLSQKIQSPYMEIQEINLGGKIGKYQSGPGIIFSVNSDPSEATKLVVAIYKIGDETPKRFFNKTSSSATKSMTIPYSYLGAGDYFWRARLETDDGGASDWVDFRYNPGEADYSLFEGFEPYPYGYRFYNNVPDPKILGGGVGYHIDTVSPYYHMDYIPGNKWDIFDRAFDTSPGSGFEPGSLKALLAFETLGLNNDEAFQGGNCYGMSTSAIMQYAHPDFLKSYFPRFSDLIGLGNIWDKIYSPSSTSAGAWDIYNDTLDTILTLQLGQYSSVQREAMENALHDPQKIMDELRKDSTKAYLLLLEGEDINGDEKGHAVVPYKVEGNRIYIWDNNVQYPRNGPDKAYDQYVEIKTDGTFYSPLYNLTNLAIYKWKKITRLDLVNSDTIYNGGKKSVPAGFMGIKFLYTLSGKSDLLISDSEGRLSGFSGGTILEEIPGVDVITPYNATLGGTIENTRKQIYIPEKIDGLSIKVVGKNQENYNLMIAGGDYYTKVSGVSTNSGQTDTFASTNTGLTINFDDSKTGEYSLFAANFQDTLTGIVFLSGITSIPQSQEYSIDWSKVIQNSNDSISYQIDTDNDGMYDISSNFSSVLKSLNEKGSISGYVKGDTNASMAGWKVFIDLNGDGVLQEKKEPFQVTDNKGYYKFGNLDKGIFNIIEIPHQNWNLIKPVSKKYSINLNNGQNIVNLNFENSFSKGKSK